MDWNANIQRLHNARLGKRTSYNLRRFFRCYFDLSKSTPQRDTGDLQSNLSKGQMIENFNFSIIET